MEPEEISEGVGLGKVGRVILKVIIDVQGTRLI